MLLKTAFRHQSALNPSRNVGRLRAGSTWFATRLWLVLLVSIVSGAGAPAYPVRNGANGRCLVDQNNTPILIAGDAPQALVVNISEADAAAYFADRAALGFNTLWINLLCTTYTGGRADSSTFDGTLPFTAMVPATGSYDLTTPNPAYFAHVDRILNLAAQCGLQVLLDPIETGGFLPTLLDNGTARCRTYGQYLGTRYRGFPNVIWMSGNDFSGWTSPANDSAVAAVALGIRDNDTVHLQTIELGAPEGSLDDANWAPIISIDAAYSWNPAYSQVLTEFNRPALLPVVNVESIYEFENLWTGNETLRRQEYWTMFSGAAGQIYGNHYVWPFLTGWQNHLDTSGAIQFGLVQVLMTPRRWYNLVPDQNHTVVTAGYGTFAASGDVNSNDYVAAARTTDGTLVLAYLPSIRAITIDLSKLSAPAAARWYDPTAGIFAPIPGSPFANTGVQNFTPPGANAAGDGDWVLVLETSVPSSGDTSPPATPTGLTATAAGNSQINLTWTASTDNVRVAGYLVQRQNSGSGSFLLVGTSAGAAFSDTGLLTNTAYSYRIQAVDAAGNVSGFSNVAGTTTSNSSVPGLVAAYNFDEASGATVADSSGNGNTGVVSGASWTTAGRHAGALVFNGSGALVTINDAPSLHLTTAMTLEAWVNPTAISEVWRDVIYKGDDTYYLEASSDESCLPAGGGTFSGPVFAAAALPANAWTHLASTYDGAMVRIYINGSLVTAEAKSENIASSAHPLQIGGDSLWGQFFQGTIDDVRVYNRALGSAEIQTDMNAPVSPPGNPPSQVAVLTTPVNGAANVFAPCLFQWTSAAAAQAYYLDVGTTPGAKDIVNSGTLLFSQTTCPAQSLPVSQTLYASIWTKLAGVWKPSYSTFTTGQQIAMLTSFASGASRVPTTGTIAWTSAPYAQNYRLQIGTTPSAGDVVDTGPIKNLSVGVSGLPGRQMLYASLSTEIGGQWYSSMSTFTTMPVTAILKTPADGTVSVLSPCVFQWTAVDAAQAYCLDVGTTPGAKDVINSGTLPVTGTTYAAKSLPRGQTLYASLWTKLAGVWWPSDGTFTTAP